MSNSRTLSGSEAPPEQAETQQVVGTQMRELRKAKGMTLQGLANNTGLSVGYLSQLELQKATPSIKALNGIARAMGVNVSWFFPDGDPDANPEAAVVVRSSRRRALRFASGIRDELLCPTLSGQLEMLHCTLEPGASSGDPYGYVGEQAGYIAEGRLELRVDEEIYILNAGDSFHFNCSRPHAFRNPSEQKTVVIWSVTPPHY